ncbi:MAG: MBL fold metallo-hydrolase [Proteobacteria bacterium]|nr:MAG: MBL fold metallo-hydrolase [Pseudomonadota bacterium]
MREELMLEINTTIKIGDYRITAFSDGLFQTTIEAMVGVDKETTQALSGKTLTEPVYLSVNAFLVEGRGMRALIDAGTGNTFGPALGHLPANLRAAGVALDSITHVLLTHIHPDHSNGLIDETGNKWFPNAEVVVQEDEIKFWVDRDLSEAAHERQRGNMVNARKAFAPYRKQTTRIRDGEFLSGLIAEKSPGHTPAHNTWTIESGGDSLIVWGDTIHMSSIQLARPEATWIYDADPAMAVRSRRHLLDRVSADHTRVAGMHLDFPGYGFVKRREGGYFIEPE